MAAVDPRESLRIIQCARADCGQLFFLCCRCDRGHVFCSGRCRDIKRGRDLREARRRHQQSREGRLDHADRQRAYRARFAQRRKNVTDHTSENLPFRTSLFLPLSGDRDQLPKRNGAKEQEHGKDLDGDSSRSAGDASAGDTGKRNDTESASESCPEASESAACVKR